MGGSKFTTLTAHFRVEQLSHGAPLISCQSSRPRTQCHRVKDETEAVVQQVMNMVKRASDAGMRNDSGIL